MKKSLSIIALTFALVSMNSMVVAQTYYQNDNQRYNTKIANPQKSLIQDFKADIGQLNEGQVIKFYIDGESKGRAVVKFNSAGNFWRTVNLTETESGRYTGQYTIRGVDRLEDKTFSATLTRGKTVSDASYSPFKSYGAYDSKLSNHTDEYKNVQKPSYNSNYGTITEIHISDANTEELNMGGTAIGAVVGGLLGNQIGNGKGKTAASVIGAIAGGVAGNQVGKSISKEKVWNVSVKFDDGKTSVYKYTTDPQVQVGTNVQKEGTGISRR